MVYEGINLKNDDETVAVKVLKPIDEIKIKKELMIMETVKGHPNIINLIDVIRDPRPLI